MLNGRSAQPLTLIKIRRMTQLTTRQIFIVDDNEIYAMMLDYFLSKDSIYHFVSFNSGEDCIKNLYLNPDVIILDYGLPGMNGYFTLLEIKKRSPHMHVIILTANKNKRTEEELLKAGADYVVLKQDHGEKQLIQKIETLIKKDDDSWKETSFIKKMSYFFLFVFLLALGIFLYK
jgi:DNA-binding NarL/FixJ family response regulator